MEENYTDIDEIIAKVSNIGRGGKEQYKKVKKI